MYCWKAISLLTLAAEDGGRTAAVVIADGLGAGEAVTSREKRTARERVRGAIVSGLALLFVLCPLQRSKTVETTTATQKSEISTKVQDLRLGNKYLPPHLIERGKSQ